MEIYELERRTRAPDALGPAPRAELLRPDAPGLRASRSLGEFWSYPESRAFAELLIDCEEDRTLGTVSKFGIVLAAGGLSVWAGGGSAWLG